MLVDQAADALFIINYDETIFDVNRQACESLGYTRQELLAKAIHNLSPRRGRPLIRINSAALPACLIEAELFGSEKGAFTGAVSKKWAVLKLLFS